MGRRDPSWLRSTALVALGATALVGGSASSTAAQGVEQAEELYSDVFGCWTCHGPRGRGGDGQPLRGTYLPLSVFIKELRLPAGEMPPFGDLLATDGELATVYAWLEGADPVAQPLAVEVALHPVERAWSSAGGEVVLTTRLPPSRPRVRLRMTAMERDDSLLGDLDFELRAAGTEEWTTVRTDRYGQAEWLTSGGTSQLRLRLPVGSHVLVVEALDHENPGDPTVLGVGSTVLRVE